MKGLGDDLSVQSPQRIRLRLDIQLVVSPDVPDAGAR